MAQNQNKQNNEMGIFLLLTLLCHIKREARNFKAVLLKMAFACIGYIWKFPHDIGAKGERRNGFHHLEVYASKKPKKQWGISNALEEVILFENCSLDFSNFLKVRHNFFSSNHRHESNVLNSCFNFRDKPGYISDSWVRFGYRRVFSRKLPHK